MACEKSCCQTLDKSFDSRDTCRIKSQETNMNPRTAKRTMNSRCNAAQAARDIAAAPIISANRAKQLDDAAFLAALGPINKTRNAEIDAAIADYRAVTGETGRVTFARNASARRIWTETVGSALGCS